MSYDSSLDERIQNIFTQVEDLNITIKGKERIQKNIQDDLNTYVAKQEDLVERVRVDEESIEVFKSVVDTRNKSAKDKLESMLNFALQNIPLENDYTLEIEEFNTKRSGREFAIKLFDKKANKTRGIRTQSGTAVAQIVSFLMRIVVISFSGSRRLLVIDENLSGLQDKETINMFGEILVALAKNENFQIIMVEHKSGFNHVEGLHNYMLEKKSYKDGVILKEISTAGSDD